MKVEKMAKETKKDLPVTREKVIEHITPIPSEEELVCDIPEATKYKITLAEGAHLFGAPGDIDEHKVATMLKEMKEKHGNVKAVTIVEAIRDSFYPDAGWTLLRKKHNFTEKGSSFITTDDRLMREYYFRKMAAKTFMDEKINPPQRKRCVPQTKVHRFDIKAVEYEQVIPKG